MSSVGTLDAAQRMIDFSKIDKSRNKICESCVKEDVCQYKEECMKAVKDIESIKDRLNVFISADLMCKKWNERPSVNVINWGHVLRGENI